MVPGYPLIQLCPHCGTEKLLLSLLSGNTHGARLWSDNKQVAPMLPRLSVVQKCPACGGYFMLLDGEPVYSKKKGAFSTDTGRLSYEEMNEAYQSLRHEEMPSYRRLELLLEMIHSFNDAYRYGESEIPRTKENIQQQREILLEAIGLLEPQGEATVPMRAEFYRERGEFQKCLSLLQTYNPANSFIQKICDRITSKALDGDTMVFEISGSN